MIFSKIFEKTGSSDTGLLFSIFFLSFFLYSGMTLASFNLSGTRPSRNDLLKKSASGSAMECRHF